jgi:hypothetical protein
MHDSSIRNLVAFLAMAFAAAGCAGSAGRTESAYSYSQGGGQTTSTGYAQEEASPRASVQYDAGGDGEAGGAADADMAAPEMAPPPPAQPMSPGAGGVASRSAPPTMMMQEQRAPTPEPNPQHRPGLGTEFGEQRHSQISFVSFQRSSQQPFATVALNYNDSQGVAAMVSHDMARGAAMAPVGIDPRGELTISIVDEFGRPLPALSIGGRIYIIGEAGRRYSIQVRNNGSRRFEIVASVDGLDVMDGREASFAKRGYIAGPFQSFTIDGFRTSESQVAAFRFGSVRNSYAARTGSARNVGVIGVALFSEMGVNYWDENEIRTRQNADPFPGRFSQPPM